MLSDKAYSLIKHKITTLELPPSELIDEKRLVDELEIGRTPIREALRRLEAENLVTIVPRRGTFVTDVSITDLQALAELRREVEGLAARLAARRAKSEHLSQMEALFEDFDQVVAENGNAALMDRDKRFHHLIYEAANNKFLEDILDQLYTLSLRLWHLSLDNLSHQTMKETIEEHLTIIEALREGDPDKAERVMQKHVVSFQEQMKAVL